MTTPHRTLLQQSLEALSGLVLNPESHPLITALREALAAPEPEPVAEVYRARYGRRARNVGVNDVRKLNGVALPPLGTKLYAAPLAAPAVPLTDTETHAELWKLAVRKGLITVRSELIDPRNHGTRVSWMQGHDKACDISNDAAAHGIAASPEQPK